MIHVDHKRMEPLMRTHLHSDYGMSHLEIGKVLFSIGLTDRPLTAHQVLAIERRALRKLRKALTTTQKGN